MKVKCEIHPRYEEPEIHICCKERNDEAEELYRAVKDAVDTKIIAYDDMGAVPLNSCDIIRIYYQGQKVCAATAKGDYRLHERLYELEEKLDKSRFLRISNSEIVNLRKIKRLDTKLTGTVKMYLSENMETYVSRRYVPKIKKALGI